MIRIWFSFLSWFELIREERHSKLYHKWARRQWRWHRRAFDE